MARKKKPSGRPHRGPFDFNWLERAIKADGFELLTGERAGTKHPAYENPGRPGKKVQLAKKWDSIYANDEIFRSIASQAGISPKALLRLLNNVR